MKKMLSKEEIDHSTIAYFNDKFMPLAKVKISPLDRGFLFADGVYEVVPVYDKTLFCFDEHLSRLFKSLNSIQINTNLSKIKLLNIVNELVKRNKGNHQIIYIQITRGVSKRNHAFPKNWCLPTIFAMSSELVRPTIYERERGVKVTILNDNRWNSCNIKSISLLANVLAREEAYKDGCAEAVLFKNSLLTEGAASTIWIVKNDVVLIPEKSPNILEGIRIKLIKKICKKVKIGFKRCNISYENFINAEEIFMSSATREVIAITEIKTLNKENKIIEKKIGPVFKKIQSEYDKLINKQINLEG
ncbi:MAG: hypothetical protein CBD16_08730 [Betaproteobacteria bacterium TMED156]|nr:MAG: hypothetical protein CBD16_08730 [Betaproteobacteria bacterium TMED156]|tara:strand:- start:3559 stop:4467 length:909 start_codon:yes stop_codon:yes gene_type:complete